VLTERKTSWGRGGKGNVLQKKLGIEREIRIALLKDSLELKE
jgi:hypothetical protein